MMTRSNFIFSVICLSILFPLKIQAQSLKVVRISSDQTNVDLGKTLILNATYNYTGSSAVGVLWRIGISKVLVEQVRGGNLDISDSRASLEGRATLVLKNTTLSDNGTYTLKASISGYTSPEETFTVIIQVKSNATINCTTPVNLTEGENLSCICYGVGGSPSPTAYWLKGNNTIPITEGYLSALLDIRNVSKNDTGTYTCRVQSGTLIDKERINVTVLHGPTFISFISNVANNNANVGDNVVLTAKADGNPKPSYNITFVKNGTVELRNSSGGILKIKNISISDNGTYRCVATNNFGSKEAELVLHVKKNIQPTTTTSTTVSASSTNTTTASSSVTITVPPITTGTPTSKKDKSIAPIVGGAIGGLVFLIICIVLIWYCCCKRSASGSCKRGDGGEEDIVVNPANPSYVAAMGDSMDGGNPYESFDQAKIDQARAADEAGPSNESPPDAGNGLPPVYAVVDKSKKTPKPPPEKQPDSLTYASLDPVVLQPNSSKMRDRTREETNYASIDLEKLKKDQE